MALVVGLTSCNRSPQFRNDEATYKPEPPSAPSYYDRNQAPPSKTGKLETVGQPKKRVFVFDFWNDTPIKQSDLGMFAADELRRYLYLSQRLIVPTDVKSDMATNDFLQGDKVKVAQLIREGKRMGVTILMVGRISKIVFRQRGDDVGLLRNKQSMVAVDTEVKLFDVGSGREVMAIGKSGDASSTAMVAIEGSNLESPEFRAEMTKLAIRKAMSHMLPDVLRAIEKLQWEGRVAKISGSKVYVNAGKASGLVAGDILKILSPGDDVYDKSTGAYLGRAQGQLKGTLEVVDFIGTDGAVSEIHTGGNFQEGDVVQLY